MSSRQALRCDGPAPAPADRRAADARANRNRWRAVASAARRAGPTRAIKPQTERQMAMPWRGARPTADSAPPFRPANATRFPPSARRHRAMQSPKGSSPLCGVNTTSGANVFTRFRPSALRSAPGCARGVARAPADRHRAAGCGCPQLRSGPRSANIRRRRRWRA